MKKQISLSLIPDDMDEFRRLIPARVRSKTIESFLIHDYKLPEDFAALAETPEVYAVEPLRLSQDVIELMETHMEQAKQGGYGEVSRSSIMRDVIKQLNAHYRQRAQLPATPSQRKHSSFYFERGTKEILDQWIGHRDRNFVIEQFLLNPDFRLSIDNRQALRPGFEMELLKMRPEHPESIRINLSDTAFDKLDELVQAVSLRGVTRTAVMRQVVRQLIEHLSGESFNELLMKKRLQGVMKQYAEVAGVGKVKEAISEYLTDEEKR